MRLLLLALLVCPALSQAYSVTFQVDMKQESVSPQGVHIAGNFQSEAGFGADWNPASTAMSDSDGDGIYSAILDIPSGIWEFKYVNGSTWTGAENAPAICTVGANFNRTVQVPTQNLVVPTVVFNQCPSIPMDTTTLCIGGTTPSFTKFSCAVSRIQTATAKEISKASFSVWTT